MKQLRQLWYRVRTEELPARALRTGDRILLGFPGTGPYLTAPGVVAHPDPVLGFDFDTTIAFAGGTWIQYRSGARVRIARKRWLW
jgi:hypothetical protein